MKDKDKSKDIICKDQGHKWLCVNARPRLPYILNGGNPTLPGTVVVDSRGRRYIMQRAGNLVGVDK